MPRAAFVAIGTYVPDRVVTNAELTKYMDTTEEWIVQRTGIQERHWVEPGLGSAEMAHRATRRALDQAGWKAEDIEAIIFAKDILRLARALLGASANAPAEARKPATKKSLFAWR